MKKIALLFIFIALSLFPLLAQKTITGTVTEENGETIPGATVRAKGFTTVATITDLDGKYSLEVPDEAKILIFSSMTKETQEVEIGSQTVINVVLMTKTEEIETVIVSAVGISRDSKAVGYSVSSVGSEKLEQKSEPDLLRNLKGKIPGVNVVSSSGAPGSATRITIRGNSSFYGNNQPLIVVDGVPYSNDQFNSTSQSVGGGAVGSSFSTLDPNDIKSMNVLKGAAAAALYGSRAANGVIIIETKSGSTTKSKNKVNVSYSVGYSQEQISNLPEYQNTYGPGTNFKYFNYNGSWGAKFGTIDSIPVWEQFKEAFPDVYTSDSVAYVAQPDNVKNLFKTGHLLEQSVTVSGGNDKSTFSLTGSTSANDGYIPYSSFERKSISLGGSTEVIKGLRVRSSFSYSDTHQSGGMFGNNQAIADETSSSFARNLWLGRNWIITDEQSENPSTGGSVTPNIGQFDNPFWAWKHAKSITGQDRTVANVNATYNFLEKFTFSFTGGANVFNLNRKEYIAKGSKAYAGKGGIINDNIKTNEIEATSSLQYEDDVTDVINLKVTLGHNINQRTSDRQAYQGKSFVVDGVYDIDNTEDVVAIGGGYSQRRIMGVFADVSVGFKRFLFLNLAARNDWSSTLPIENNSYFYPAVSGSFLVTEAFGIKSNILNFVKLRGGWAQTGNDASPYAKEYFDNRGGSFPFLGQSTMYIPNTSYDTELKNELSSEMEFGVNLIMFNKRVNLDVTYYDKLSKNQIIYIAIPATSGYTSLYTNSGAISNKGFEVGLNLTPVRRKSFKWDIYTTFTNNKNIIEKIPEGYDRIVLAGVFGDPQAVFEEGQPYGALRGTVAATDEDGNYLINRADGVLIPSTELTTIGDPNPEFILGLSNSVTWKGFSFTFQLSYKHGGDLFSNSLISMLGRGVTKDTEDREHSYILPGVYGDPDTEEPILDVDGNTIDNVTQVDMNALVFGNSYAINGVSEFGIYDASVFRLSQVGIAYNFPKKMFANIPLSGISITFTGNNLWYYAPNVLKYSNLDPELNTYGASNLQGIEYSAAPSVRRFGVNLKITF